MPEISFLPVLLVILLAAVVVVAVFRRLNLNPVLGYFVAGSVISTDVLDIVSANDLQVFAEFGVVFLLFAIGLEMTYERLKTMRKHVFGFGTLQVILTSLAIATISYLFGCSIATSIVLGGGLALSSTAIVLQVIAENRTQSTQVGRLSLAMLILQDFAVVPLLVLVPLLANGSTDIWGPIGHAFIRAVLALFVIFIVGRLLLRPLFGMIGSANAAKTNELFVATTLLIALGAAWCTEHLGLSLALGAFVAGVLVAETEFQHQAEESITPFKGLFLGLFFMTVGMEINITMILEKWTLVILYTGGLILIKGSIIALLCLLFRFSIGSAIHAGLLLSQGSEFAFILFGLATEQSILERELGEMLLLVVTTTMALTPALSVLGEWIANRLAPRETQDAKEIVKEVADLENHVIIAGFGRVGRMVARLLEAEHVRYVAIDTDAEKVSEAIEDGYPVYRGDGSHMEMLRALGIERAVCILSTVPNEVTLKKSLRTIHQEFPNLPVIVRAKDLSNTKKLQEMGVTIVVPEAYETGLQLGGAALKVAGVSEFEVSRIKNHFRAGNYVLAKNVDEHFLDEEEEGTIPTTAGI